MREISLTIGRKNTFNNFIRKLEKTEGSQTGLPEG